MGKPVEVIWDKDDFLHLIDEAKRARYRQAIADLRRDELIEKIALATAEHWLTDNQDADRNNICACGEWADSEDNGWDDHMAHVTQAVAADFLESRLPGSGTEVGDG